MEMIKEAVRRPYVPIEVRFPSFEKKRSGQFVAHFLNSYYLLLVFICRKYKININHVVSLLFDFIYVGCRDVPAGDKSQLVSSGMTEKGQLIWIALSSYFESQELKEPNYPGISNLIRASEMVLPEGLEQPEIFQYRIPRYKKKRKWDFIVGKKEIDLNLSGIVRVQNYGKQLRNNKMLFRDSLANEYIQFLVSFELSYMENHWITLKIVNVKMRERCIC